jgi:hypothetical protein
MESVSQSWTPAWEDSPSWQRSQRPNWSTEAVTLASDMTNAQTATADVATGPSCVVYDEDMAQITIAANSPDGNADFGRDVPPVLKDTDAFARQGDKGPYHWVQGPQDVRAITVAPPPPTPPVEASPNPEPIQPGKLPRKGQALTTTNLRLRKKAGTDADSLGVMPTGTVVQMTGGRKRIGPDLWVRVEVIEVAPQERTLRNNERWLNAPPGRKGWVDSDFLAVPASEYVAKDMPPITHEWLWWLDDSGGLDAETVRKTLTAIADDPRGPLRAGLDVREATIRDEADVLVRMVDDACSGAAGCYYKQTGQKARVDIAKQWWNTAWLSRVWLHECTGHGATRAYDHYNGAPQYPRPDYSGIMGNWQDHYGDHAWPDRDDIENFVAWLAGESDLVFVRDIATPAG